MIRNQQDKKGSEASLTMLVEEDLWDQVGPEDNKTSFKFRSPHNSNYEHLFLRW